MRAGKLAYQSPQCRRTCRFHLHTWQNPVTIAIWPVAKCHRVTTPGVCDLGSKKIIPEKRQKQRSKLRNVLLDSQLPSLEPSSICVSISRHAVRRRQRVIGRRGFGTVTPLEASARKLSFPCTSVLSDHDGRGAHAPFGPRMSDLTTRHANGYSRTQI